MKIGRLRLPGRIGLAPMAGITDAPFRAVCRRLGAAWTVTEMVSANPALRGTPKSRARLTFLPPVPGVPRDVRIVQIAGPDPEWCADAARHAVASGADVVDINMGCPAKKVCNRQAGSALMRDERLVAAILERVVAAVDVPVTLKTRAGWDPAHKNVVAIARIAEAAGVSAIAVHGRTRACRFGGAVDYAIIGEVKSAVSIPVIANGDLDSPEKVREVLATTGADGCLVGRGAVGNPWLFAAIDAVLTGRSGAPMATREARFALILEHLAAMHAFHGPERGMRHARKHVTAYLAGLGYPRAVARAFCELTDAAAQNAWLEALAAAPRADRGAAALARAA